MKKEEYYRVQIKTSEWTRQNFNSISLTEDSVREFAKYANKASCVLEIGCGDAYSLDYMMKCGFANVYGCDINPEKLRVARNHGNAVCVQDAHELGFPDVCFDAVYCTHTLEHTYDAREALGEIYRILSEGGLAFIIVPDHSRIYGEVTDMLEHIPSLEERDPFYFEHLAENYSGEKATFPRNQFPMTMKLLLQTVIGAGFDIQTVSRIMRDGPELWVAATKPISDQKAPDSIIIRDYHHRSPFRILLRRLKKIISAK